MNSSYVEIFFAGCLLILPFLYESSSVFRYYLKYVIYAVGVQLASVALIPYILLHPFNPSNLVAASSLCHHISTIIGLKWILRGKEHLEVQRPCIIVANHQSSLDILGMFDIWHIMDKCAVVAKKELLFTGPFGIMAGLSGLVYINRRQPAKAQAMLNSTVEAMKPQKIKLWMFPEGTRRNTGEIHEFKKGAFHVAVSAQIPILPVVYSSYYFIDGKAKQFDNGKIIITCLPPVSTEGLTKDDVDELREKVHKLMSTTYYNTNKEIKDSAAVTSYLEK